MKNKLTTLILILLVFCTSAISETIKFDTKYLEIFKTENKINAGKGKATTADGEIEIYADGFEYDKNLGLLNASKNGLAILVSKNILIEFDNAIYNQKNLSLVANNNVEIVHKNKDLKIQSNKIFFDKKNNIIKSDKKTKLTDGKNNIYIADEFFFEIDKDLLKLINLKFLDNNSNNMETPLAYMNTKTGKLFGKDIVVNFASESLNNKNEPR